MQTETRQSSQIDSNTYSGIAVIYHFLFEFIQSLQLSLGNWGGDIGERALVGFIHSHILSDESCLLLQLLDADNITVIYAVRCIYVDVYVLIILANAGSTRGIPTSQA